MRRRTKAQSPGYRPYSVKGADGLEHWYGDFRKLGGKRRALKPPGESRGTIDRDVAESLAAAHVKELIEKKHTKQRLAAGVEKKPVPKLQAYAVHHLREKAKAAAVTDRWIAKTEGDLKLAIGFKRSGSRCTKPRCCSKRLARTSRRETRSLRSMRCMSCSRRSCSPAGARLRY